MEYSETWQGQYFNILGHFFSVYCIWKIIISTVNIVFDRVGKVDPVTRGIQIVVNYMGFELDVRIINIISINALVQMLIAPHRIKSYIFSSFVNSALLPLLLLTLPIYSYLQYFTFEYN